MTNETKTKKTFNLVLWIVQSLLSAMLIWAAYMKLFSPADRLAEMWPWTANHSTLVKFTGVVDLAAGMGLILPALLRIWPRLTIYAAYGTILLMAAATVFHLSRGEAPQTVINLIFAVLALFIAWGRTKKAPFVQE